MTRWSTGFSSRFLVLGAVVGGLVALAQPRTADACSPRSDAPNVFLAARATMGTSQLSVPKNGGLVFQVVNVGDEADAKASVTIEVRSGETILPGTIESVGRVLGAYALWRWVPEGDAALPIGPLAIKIAVKDSSPKDDTVTVEDRTVAPVTPTFTVSAARQLVADDAAPMITCKNELGPGTCQVGPREVSTRALAVADVGVPLSANGQDAVYFQPTLHIYGRYGAVSGVPDETVGWGTFHAQLQGEVDEFCAQVTTVSLVDGTETTSDAKCIQNTLDLGTVPAAEESAFVKKSLGSCKTADYPPGTNADNPTGRGEGAAPEGSAGGSGDSGCTAGAKTPPSNAFLGALAFGLGLLAKRRSRRACSR